jgi:hypothetical protein
MNKLKKLLLSLLLFAAFPIFSYAEDQPSPVPSQPTPVPSQPTPVPSQPTPVASPAAQVEVQPSPTGSPTSHTDNQAPPANDLSPHADSQPLHVDNQPAHTEEPFPHYVERAYYWKVAGAFGASFSEKTKYTINESGGPTLGTTSDQGNPFANFTGELTFQSAFPLGVGFFVEGTRYEYKTSGSDGELGLYAMPRLAHTFGGVEIWAGFGVGMMVNNLGGLNSETINGVTLTLTDMVPVSFAWSPRVGFDVDLPNHVFVGAQFSYVSTTFSVPFTAFGGNLISGSIDCTRTWVGGAVRLGARL